MPPVPQPPWTARPLPRTLIAPASLPGVRRTLTVLPALLLRSPAPPCPPSFSLAPAPPRSRRTRVPSLALVILLQVAFQRRLTFQVAESVTLGPAAGIRVVWNGIHHKTEFTGAHGYPDTGYLARVTDELKGFGIE